MPTSAPMIARKPRADAPVCLLTCSTVFRPPRSVSKPFVHCRADDQRRRVSEAKLLEAFPGYLFRPAFFIMNL
jgi:hypothetical protein